MSESPKKRCARWDADWDECAGLLSGAAYSIGYHSRLNHQERVHPTRESAAYARALVESGDSARYARALRCIRTVLALQDPDPYSPTYGIWPWYAEEPLSEMAPPDWNWADFVGTSLCHLHEALPPAFPEADALRAELREALLCAAYSIFRRNVRPDYTNIALMGTVVTGYAGETFAQPLLLAYARSRIRTFRTLLEETGGVAEYNSPTYSWVAVEECERLLALVRDDAVRRDTEHVLRFLWTDLARHFHPATRQLAGPHSRAYQLYTPESLLQQLPLPGNSAPCSCPADLRERFAKLPLKPPATGLEVRCRHIRREPDSASTRSVTWMSEAACFGTVSRGNLWVQQHPVLAYWTCGGGCQPAAFQARFLRDGNPCASMGVRSVQRENTALTGFFIAKNLGDYHVSLDRPSNGIFQAERLVVRFELTAPNAAVRACGDAAAVFSAGQTALRVAWDPGAAFDGRPVRTAFGRGEACVWVDFVLAEGPARAYDFATGLALRLAAAFEVLPAAAADLPPDSPVLTASSTVWTARWRDLELEIPAQGDNA